MNQENALVLLRPQLLRFAMLRLGNRDLAEDAPREEPNLQGDAPLPESDPEEGFMQRRFFDTLERSLTRLPARPARVFVLRDVLGLDTDEVCRELAVSVSNCWVMLHRARMRLRQCPDLRGLAADAV